MCSTSGPVGSACSPTRQRGARTFLPGNCCTSAGTALVAPFDLDKLALTGAGVPVLEGVMLWTGSANIAVSHTSTLVYEQGTAAVNEGQLVRVSRDGAVAPIDTAWHGPYNSFALS